MSESKGNSILQNTACNTFSSVRRDTICHTICEKHPYHRARVPHNSSATKENDVAVNNAQQHANKNHESERSLPYRVIALVLALGRRPDNKARAVMLRGIMERVKSHPEEAMMSADDDDSLSLPEKHIMKVRFSNCLPLHILVTILFDVSIEAFQSVIRAFPAAVSLRRGPGKQTPLGILWDKHRQQKIPFADQKSHMGKLVRLLLKRMITPSAEAIAMACSLSVDLVRTHVMPYLGDPLTIPEVKGFTLLHKMVASSEDMVPSDVILNLLDAVPTMASCGAICEKYWGYLPLHSACSGKGNRPRLNIIRKLIDTYPEALITKAGEENITPLHNACRYVQSVEIIEMLIEAGSGALLMGDYRNRTPIFWALSFRRDYAMLLASSCPEALSIPSFSSHSNLPLHVVCSEQNPIIKRQYEPYACADMILFIYYQFPDAVATQNAQGFTPREIVERENHPEKMRILRVFDNAE